MAKLARIMLIKFGEKVKIWSFPTIRSKVGNEYFLRFGKIFIAAHFSYYLAADSVFESMAEAKHKFSRFLEDYFRIKLLYYSDSVSKLLISEKL